MHNYNCTFHGLHDWHNAMFEKLGWMAMAQHHHNTLKINAYKEGIQHLLECLHRKHASTRDEDRKDDLAILIDNTKCLEHCANILLEGIEHHLSNKDCISSSHKHEATFHGLHKWMKYKFEKLGWMCLAKKHGNTLKIQAYMDSIERLRASLENKLTILEENDRKADIKILHEDVCILQHAAKKVLGHVAVFHKRSSKTRKHSNHSF